MVDILKLRAWSHRKQLLGQGADDLESVIKTVIGVYSSHPSGPLSLFARTRNMSNADFMRLDSEKIAFRIPCMRGSAHIVPAEKASTIFDACLPGPDDPAWENRYSQPGRKIDPEKYPDWQRQILLLAKTPQPAAYFKGNTSIPDETLKPVLNRMALERKLLRIGSDNPRSNIISYVSLKDWDKTFFDKTPNPDLALAWLAGQYFRAFGPATIRDFQWWAGVTMGKAKLAMSSNDLTDLGEGYLIPSEELAEFEKTKILQNSRIDILPQWDCYTMGYAPDGRDRFVDREMLSKVYGKIGATGGNALGTVLINGLVHGVWTSKFKGQSMMIDLNLFEKPTNALQDELKISFSKIGTFLNAPKIDLQLSLA